LISWLYLFRHADSRPVRRQVTLRPFSIGYSEMTSLGISPRIVGKGRLVFIIDRYRLADPSVMI